MTQLTIEDFMLKIKEDEIYQQRPDEEFPDYMERMQQYPNFYQFFKKEAK